jgi:hypothetical protein
MYLTSHGAKDWPPLRHRSTKVKTMILSESSSPSTPGVTADSHADETARGGKVVHDLRGNAFWDWAVATGVLAGTKSAELLQMLDNPMLSVEGECGLVAEWAGDPYNRR